MMPDQKLLLDAVIHQESRGNPMAVSPKGAAGIMQIMPATARDPGYGVTPLQGWDGVDPRTAPVEEQIRFGKDYLAALTRANGGNTDLALAAYNAGQGNVEKYGGIPPFAETQNYVRDINARMGNTPQRRSTDFKTETSYPLNTAYQQPQDDFQSRVQWDDAQPQQPSVNFNVEWDSEVAPIAAPAPRNNDEMVMPWDFSRANVGKDQTSFSDAMTQHRDTRINQMQNSAEAYVNGEQSMAETAIQQGLAGASILTDAVGEGISRIPVVGDILRAGGQAVASLPTINGSTLGEQIPKDLSKVSEKHPRFARNAQAAGQALNLYATGTGINQVAKAVTPAVNKLQNSSFMLAEASGGAGTPAAPKAPNIGRPELKQMATESYDEAAYLNSKYAAPEVGDKFENFIRTLKPKPAANGKLTAEDKIFAKELEDFTGYKGKELALSDIQKIDQDLNAKITKFTDNQGNVTPTGLQFQKMKTKLAQITDSIDDSGNAARLNAKTYWRGQRMLGELEAAEQRASVAANPALALQRQYANLFNDKDLIAHWPQEAKDLLQKAATPHPLSDGLLRVMGNKLFTIANGAMGGVGGAASGYALNMAADSGFQALVAGRGAKVAKSIIKDTVSKTKPVNIEPPNYDIPQMLLAPPEQMSRLPMSNTEVNIAQQLMDRTPVQPRGEAVITPPVSQLTKLQDKLGRAKGTQLKAAAQMYKDGSVSQNQFVKEIVRDFGLTQTQARALAKEIKTYGEIK